MQVGASMDVGGFRLEDLPRETVMVLWQQFAQRKIHFLKVELLEIKTFCSLLSQSPPEQGCYPTLVV